MTQILFDSPEIRRDLLRLRTYALEHETDLSSGIPADHIPAGDISQHVVRNGSIKIVYSVELQPKGRCHHLSVSQAGEKIPHPMMVDALMEQLGMGAVADSKERYVWLEKDFALNVVPPFTQD